MVRVTARLLILLSLFAFTPGVAWSQAGGTLQGRVTGPDGRPVAGARVSAGGGAPAVTGAAGRYTLPGIPAGASLVRVDALGYAPAEREVKVAAGELATLDFALEAAPVGLEEMVVSATRSSTPLAALPEAVTVVSREEIEQQASLSRNLGDLVGKLVPGFSQGVESPSLWGQSLRGRNVAVLIDGVPQSTARNVSRDLSTIDPSVVERIEVIRGATAIFGNGATGGVVNIITRRPGAGAPRFTTHVGSESSLSEVGEGMGSHVRQMVSGVRGAVDYSASASFARSGGFFDAEGDRINPDPTGQGGLSDTDTWDLFGKFGVALGSQRVQLLVNHFDSRQRADHAVDPSVARLPAGEAKARTRHGLVMDDGQGSTNTLVSLDYHAPRLLGSRVHGQLYYRDYLTRFGPYDGRKARTLGHQFIQSYLDSRSAGGRLEFERTLPVATLPTVLWGLDYAVERTSQPVGIIDGEPYDQSGGLVFRRVGEKIWVPPMEPRSLGAFAQLSWSPVAHVNLRGGVRHERIGMYVDDFVTLAGDPIVGGRLDFDPVLFNLGAVVDATEQVSVFGAFSQGFSTTDIGLFLRSAPAGFQVGNKTLEPQKVNHYEVGLRTSSSVLQSSLSTFYNQSDLGTSSAGFDMNVVRAPERVYGVEATLDVQPAPRWDAGGTFTWAEGDFDPEGDGTYRALNGWRIQPMKLTGFVEHRTLPRWRNRLQVLYSGSRDRAFEERPDPKKVGFGERPVTSYTVVDWISNVRLGRGELTVGVQNLLNRQYFPVASQLIRSGNNTTFTPARGSVLSVGYSVTY